VCRCGQPIELIVYYIIKRHNAILLLPQECDTNKELTGRPTVKLQSNATIGDRFTVKPFCCQTTTEQAISLLVCTELSLKRRNIPNFIVAIKNKLVPDDFLVAKSGSM
jgi:hypothetical protein